MGLCDYGGRHRLWFNGLVVMISVLHTEGLRFDPGLNQSFLVSVSFVSVSDVSLMQIQTRRVNMTTAPIIIKIIIGVSKMGLHNDTSVQAICGKHQKHTSNMTTLRIGRGGSIVLVISHTSRPRGERGEHHAHSTAHRDVELSIVALSRMSTTTVTVTSLADPSTSQGAKRRSNPIKKKDF